MSDQKIRVGKTLDEAISFTTSNMGGIIRVGWLPIGLTIGATVGLAWVLLKPLILAYGEMIAAVSAAASAGAADGAKAPDVAFDPQIFDSAIQEIGFGNLALAYLLIIVVSMVGFAIPVAAYCRMMVNGERIRGLAYFRLGGREISVAFTYFVVMLLVMVAMIALILAIAALAGVLAAVLGTAGAVLSGLISIVMFVGMIVMMFRLFGRLGVAIPAAAVEGGIPIGHAWELTKGNAGAIGGALFVGYLAMTIIMTIAMMVLSLLSGLIAGVLISMGSNLTYVFVGSIWGVGYIAIYCVSTAFFMGLFAGPYKRLAGLTGAPTEVFD